MKEYPFRYDKGSVGQKVFLVVVDSESGEFSVDEDIILEIQDDSYHIAVDDNGEWLVDKDGEYIIERSENWQDCSVGYWVDKYNPGHALYFGEDLFETREEAEEAMSSFWSFSSNMKNGE